MHSGRLKTIYLLSIADVFFGAIGVLLILIILAVQQTDQRITETFDETYFCDGNTPEALTLINPTSLERIGLQDWLTSLPEDRFMMHIGVRPETQDLTCYALVLNAAEDANRKLERRGTTNSVLTVEYWLLDDRAAP